MNLWAVSCPDIAPSKATHQSFVASTEQECGTAWSENIYYWAVFSFSQLGTRLPSGAREALKVHWPIGSLSTLLHTARGCPFAF